MKAIVHDFYTDIYPTDEEVKSLCRPGEGANTCIWLIVGPNGFECIEKNKHPSLLNRFEKGLTTAKRDGCERVKNFSPFLIGKMGEIEVPEIVDVRCERMED